MRSYSVRLDLTNGFFYVTLLTLSFIWHIDSNPFQGFAMLTQAIIAILADRHNLTTTDIMEMMDWIGDHVMDVNELYDPADYIETFESFQRQESNQALAQDFLQGRAAGFSEVSYDPETGRELSVDDVFGIVATF